MKGLITRIQRFTVHDGPGIRTMVFLKGCPLSCAWCSNPETQAFQPELAFNPDLCRANCTLCADACPHHAITRTDTVAINRAPCATCHSHACTIACPWGAMEMYGEEKSVEQVLDIAEEDSAFYRHEGGGITLSGGEALASPAFALALLAAAKERHVHTALETCGHVDALVLEKACTLTDYLLFDVKHANTHDHALGVGFGNERILDNLALAVRLLGPALHVRTPLIPGFNASQEAVSAMGRLLADLGVPRWEVLPGHRYGEGKYLRLNRPSPCFPALEPGPFAELQALAHSFVPETPAGISR